VVVAVGAGEGEPEPVRQQGALCPQLATIGRVPPGFFPPPNGALPMAPSSASQLQSIPATPS
jgi:hypothetical protein